MHFESVKNTKANVSQGAGIAAAQTISDKNVDALLTGYVGPKALQALESTEIKIYEGVNINETVKEAVHKFNQGIYQEKKDTAKTDTLSSSPSRSRGSGRGGRGRGRGRCQREIIS